MTSRCVNSAVTVRPAVPGDHDAWLPLWLGYNAFYGREGATAPAEAITRLTWRRFFDALEPMECLVAETEGRLVGLAHLVFHRNTLLAGSTCYLQDLFAAPDLRGRGVGRALIGALYGHARARGAERVYWHTHEGNAPARRLYDRVADHGGFLLYRKDLG
jgi:GNAT superfamily N-acetyltransferase